MKVLTNHKGLEYFMTIKKLIPRQVKWAEFLFEFNFVVNYQSGVKNAKANTLTRRPNETPINNNNERQEYQMQILLPPTCIDIQPINISNGTNDITNNDLNKGLNEQVQKANRADDQYKKI